MRLHRFFVKKNIGEKTEIEISEERIVHQVQNVFRLKVNDKVIFFDGKGKDFECEIKSIDKKEIVFGVRNSTKVFVPEKKVTLFMSLIKKENFELVCEKATELGVAKIVPIVSERTLLKNLNKERIEKILVEASEQCGRGDVPELGEIMDLELLIMNSNIEEIFVVDFGAPSFSDLSLSTYHSSLLIGPEGGWSKEERKLFKEKNLKIFSLGETTLRAETAAIVACFTAMNF